MNKIKGNIPTGSLSPAVQKIFEETIGSHFVYCNLNPENNDTSDCVVRAICAATGDKWEDVLTDLFKYSIKYKYAMNDNNLFGIYLQDKGWTKHKAPYKKVGTTREVYSLKEWLKKQNKAALISVNNNQHLTYAINHKIYDTWDCSSKLISQYWTKD